MVDNRFKPYINEVIFMTVTETIIQIPSEPFYRNWLFNRDGVTGKLLEDAILTFQINNLNSTNLTIIRPFIKLYETQNGTPFKTIKGNNIIATKVRKNYNIPFQLTDEEEHKTKYISIELRFDDTYDITFNHLMLYQGTNKKYTEPDSELPEELIGFKNNYYCLLFNKNDNGYLQVIRPEYDHITTKKLSMGNVTVLVPHLETEDNIDRHDVIGLEYMNSTDQVIKIK